MAGLHTNRGRKRAREARQALSLDPERPLDCLLTVVEERARLPVGITDGLPNEVAGACFREGGRTMLWVNGTHVAARQRFTLAHELGHDWCRHDGRLAVDTFETMSGKTSNPREIEANAFAAEFLLPRAAIDGLIQQEPTLEDVIMIAVRYGVSPIVVVYRVNELKLASSERVAQLKQEIEERLHEQVAKHLALEPLEDRIATVELPYLSPSLDATLLGAAVEGSAAVDTAAARAMDRLL